MINNNRFKLAPVSVLALALTACGGSGGGAGSSSQTNIQAPVINAETFVTKEDVSVNGKISATDADNNNLTFQVKRSTSHGQLKINQSGSFSYQPNDNFHGNDNFSVQVSDGKHSVSADFSITIESVNDLPELNNIKTLTRLGRAVTIQLPEKDADGDSVTYSFATQPKKGQVSLSQNSFTYKPDENATGIDSFNLSASDAIQTVTATVIVDNNLAITGNVNIDGADPQTVTVLVSSDATIQQVTPNQQGEFKLYGLADGSYSIKAMKQGYKLLESKVISLSDDTSGNVNKVSVSPVELEFESLEPGVFVYEWKEDNTLAGNEHSATVIQPLTVEILDETFDVIDDASATKLQHDYNVVLVDSGASWTQEHAYRLLQTMESIPQQKRLARQAQTLTPSKWVLTAEHLADDIQISEEKGIKQVVISTDAFNYANPKLAKVEGKRGIFYSQKLHHALVRFVTDNGNDEQAYERILTQRYGVSTLVPDYVNLTSDTTGSEGSGRFQKFHPEEVVQIINMFEEMPVGYHKVPELKYLVRRLDGTPHPLYPTAPAVAWPEANTGYIEFMETAFNIQHIEHMHRLIIHEKAHFLWQHQFDDKLKADWIELGGWFEDPTSTSGWSTTKQTEFVSAYAHSENPNEDMAESMSYFVLNPDKLRSRASEKYEFVRDRIMQGNIYISKIRDDLTFEVYNLYPDYVFPGKIKRLKTRVEGLENEDKTVTIEIELHALDTEVEGAKNAYMNIFSDVGTQLGLYLYPIDDQGQQIPDGQGTLLRGSFELSKHAKSGYWYTEQIKLTDAVGNERFEGHNDFGWKLYINNSQEDITAPQYVANSAKLEKATATVEQKQVQKIVARWEVDEAVGMANDNACYISMNDEIATTYRFESHGSYDNQAQRCVAELLMPDYMPSSTYSLNYLVMKDLALNETGVYFSEPDPSLDANDVNLDEQPATIDIVTATPDTTQPELDVNDIQITAKPTNPESPNGETEVTITFRIRDDISGYNLASLYLRDPQGINHQRWAYNGATYSLFPSGDPTQWKTFTRTIILPVGSAPGTWGLAEMTVYDRAGNFKGYDFTEILHFDILH